MVEARPSWLPSTPRDGVTLLLVLASLGLGVHGIAEWLDHQHRLVDTPRFAPLFALRLVSLSFVVTTLSLAWRGRATLVSGAVGPVGFALRGLGSGLLLAWAAGSGAAIWLSPDKTVVGSAFWSTLIAFVAAWTGCALLASARLFSVRRRVLDTVLWNFFLWLMLAEVIISLWAWANPSPFLWDESSVTASIEARRLEPLASRLGSTTNSGGYYDDEFHAPRDANDLVVAVLADSFGVGVVPHSYGFATVAERRLGALLPDQRVALHNFGVPGIGMPEYAWLLEYEVPAVSPQLVLLCVFVGNDFQSYTRNRGSYYSFRRFVIYELARRLAGTRGAVVEGGMLDTEHLAEVETPQIPAPGKEVATFEVARFLKIERDRMEVTDPGDADVTEMYERFFSALASIRRSAGDRLRVVLIPDEFQVNDELWQTLLAGQTDAERFERDLPQRRVLAYCREHGLACLDLLPEIRDANERESAYHLRDTHWNAHGNRVAGESIARFLEATLP